MVGSLKLQKTQLIVVVQVKKRELGQEKFASIATII